MAIGHTSLGWKQNERWGSCGPLSSGWRTVGTLPCWKPFLDPITIGITSQHLTMAQSHPYLCYSLTISTQDTQASFPNHSKLFSPWSFHPCCSWRTAPLPPSLDWLIQPLNHPPWPPTAGSPLVLLGTLFTSVSPMTDWYLLLDWVPQG